jgi:hypothetical protein
VAGVGTFILGRPRPLHRHRRARDRTLDRKSRFALLGPSGRGDVDV